MPEDHISFDFVKVMLKVKFVAADKEPGHQQTHWFVPKRCTVTSLCAH